MQYRYLKHNAVAIVDNYVVPLTFKPPFHRATFKLRSHYVLREFGVVDIASWTWLERSADVVLMDVEDVVGL